VTNNEACELAAASVDEGEVVDLLKQLVGIPSVTGDESAVAAALVKELADTGCQDTRTFEFLPGRDNAYGIHRGNGGPGRNVMFLGHIDTVHVGGWEDRWRGTERESPYSGHVVDGALWGRGAADQKGGIAACIAALRAVRRAGIPLGGDVSFAFVGDEESGEEGSGYSDGIKAVLREIGDGRIPVPDFAVYTEPTELRIDIAQIGFLCADVKITGKSAYFATPWLGVDAIGAATAFLTRLLAHAEELPQRGEHPLLGKRLLVLTGIKGGGYIAVAGECTISLIQTVMPGESLASAKEELDAMVEQVAKETGVEAHVEYTTSRDDPIGGGPGEVAADDPSVAMLADSVEAVLGRPATLGGFPAWSEVPFLVNELGVPGVYFAPGDLSNCHTTEERLDVEELVTATRVMARFIVDYCNTDG
jgi:acetylornithine deacetylase